MQYVLSYLRALDKSVRNDRGNCASVDGPSYGLHRAFKLKSVAQATDVRTNRRKRLLSRRGGSRKHRKACLKDDLTKFGMEAEVLQKESHRPIWVESMVKEGVEKSSRCGRRMIRP